MNVKDIIEQVLKGKQEVAQVKIDVVLKNIEKVVEDELNMANATVKNNPNLISAKIQSPKRVNGNTYLISVDYPTVHRDSLYPEKYGGVDMVQIIDSGYSASKNVYGKKGIDKYPISKISRQGTNFLEKTQARIKNIEGVQSVIVTKDK